MLDRTSIPAPASRSTALERAGRATIEALERRVILSVSPVGPEFQVSSFTAGDQRFPAMAMDGDGDFVVAWESLDPDGSLGIYAQRYSATGVPQGLEFRVNTTTANSQFEPAVAMDADGDFVVAWASLAQDGDGAGVYTQRYNAAGVAQGFEFRVNTFTTNSQLAPTVAMDAAGGFVVAWESVGQDGSSSGIYAQRFNFAGLPQGSEFRVNTFTTQNQREPSVSMDADGDFVVVWQSFAQDGSDSGIFAQRYNAAGVAQGTEFRVNTYTTNHQSAASVSMDADGDFVVAWQSYYQDDSYYGAYAQRYNAAGEPQGSEFQVHSFTTHEQNRPVVTMDADGDFAVAWQSSGQDGSDYGIYAQLYSSDGVAQGAEFKVNTFTTSSQQHPAVAMSDSGGFVVVWQSVGQDGSGFGIYAQRYDESTDTAGPVIAGVFVNGKQASPYSVHAGPVDELVVSFSENVTDAGGPTGVHSVTNPANWSIVHHDGTTVSDATIASIGYLFNAATNRFEATLQLFGGFAAGNLQIIPADNIRDIAGNALDDDLDGTPGGERSLTFGISAPGPRGPEFRVNTFTSQNQAVPAIGMDADGDFVVTWFSFAQDGSDGGIYAQRYDASGIPQGSEFRVNTFTTGNQTLPAIGVDADGDFVVTWDSSAQDGSSRGVYAQRYDASGIPQGSEFRVNTFTTGSQASPAIGMDADGDFVVTWHSNTQDGSGYGIYAQRYNASGIPQSGEFRVTTFTSENQAVPTIGMDADGNFVVTWQSNTQDGSGYGIYAQRYNASGIPQGSEFRVNTFTSENQALPAIGMDADGDFVVAWTSYLQDGSGLGTYAQRYSASGIPQGSEFRVNTFTTGNQHSPAIGMDADGEFVVAWNSYAQDGSGFGVYAQRYDASGVAQGSEFRVNTFTAGSQASPAIGMDADGEFVVTWDSFAQDGSAYGIYAQRYDLGATPVIATLSDIPDPVVAGNSVTLTATGVNDDRMVSSVWFYRESNGIEGLQFGSGGDTLVGMDTDGSNGFAAAVSTAALSGGTYTYHAQALDNENLAGAPSSTTNTVIGTAPAVTASDFLFQTAPQRLTFTFNQNVSASLSESDFTGIGTPGVDYTLSYNGGTNTATLSFTSILADANYTATIVAAGVTNAAGTPMAANHVFNFFFQNADANRDGAVNLTDFNILAANFGQTGRTFSQGNFDYDPAGNVNLADFNILAGRFGIALVPAPQSALFGPNQIKDFSAPPVDDLTERPEMKRYDG